VRIQRQGRRWSTAWITGQPGKLTQRFLQREVVPLVCAADCAAATPCDYCGDSGDDNKTAQPPDGIASRRARQYESVIHGYGYRGVADGWRDSWITGTWQAYSAAVPLSAGTYAVVRGDRAAVNTCDNCEPTNPTTIVVTKDKTAQPPRRFGHHGGLVQTNRSFTVTDTESGRRWSIAWTRGQPSSLTAALPQRGGTNAVVARQTDARQHLCDYCGNSSDDRTKRHRHRRYGHMAASYNTDRSFTERIQR
jgi:hypothetical protein